MRVPLLPSSTIRRRRRWWSNDYSGRSLARSVVCLFKRTKALLNILFLFPPPPFLRHFDDVDGRSAQVVTLSYLLTVLSYFLLSRFNNNNKTRRRHRRITAHGTSRCSWYANNAIAIAIERVVPRWWSFLFAIFSFPPSSFFKLSSNNKRIKCRNNRWQVKFFFFFYKCTTRPDPLGVTTKWKLEIHSLVVYTVSVAYWTSIDDGHWFSNVKVHSRNCLARCNR